MVQPALAEDLGAPLADARVVAAVACEPADQLDDAIAAHADERANPRVIDRDVEFSERLDPGMGVRVVAVDERAVDIEQDSVIATHDRGLASWHARCFTSRHGN